MTYSISRRHILSLTFLTLAAASAPVLAQDIWPSKPIRLVLPFSAGGPADIVTRLIAQALNKQLGQSVIVDNKPGAGGIIGSDAVAKSAPDGYTLLIAGNGAIANALLRAKMPYADADLVPVVTTHTSPSVMVTSASSGFSNLTELQAYGKSAEQGFPGIRIQHWGGIYAPRGTPPAILDRIAKALQTAAQTDPDMRAKFEATGNELLAGTRQDFELFTVSEKKRLGKIVADSKMSLD